LGPQGSSSHKVLLLETLFPFMQHYNTMSVKIVLSKRKQRISNIYWGYIPVDSRSPGTQNVPGLRPPDYLHTSFLSCF